MTDGREMAEVFIIILLYMSYWKDTTREYDKRVYAYMEVYVVCGV